MTKQHRMTIRGRRYRTIVSENFCRRCVANRTATLCGDLGGNCLASKSADHLHRIWVRSGRQPGRVDQMLQFERRVARLEIPHGPTILCVSTGSTRRERRIYV